MSQSSSIIPAVRATKLSVLGQHMQETNIPAVECKVPCIARGGLYIPVLGTQAIKAYVMSGFRLSVTSSEDTGDGTVTLTPKPSELDAYPRVGLPIYHPDDMTPEALNVLAEHREGFSALHTSFGMELNEAGRPIGTAAMFGVLGDGSELALPYDGTPMDDYLDVITAVGTRKWEAEFTARRAARTQTAIPPELVSA